MNRGTDRKRSSSRDDLKQTRDDAIARVLVVEDDADLGEAVCEILLMSGYRATQAADGIVALNALRAGRPPDLILLDLMMPRMDGWQFRDAMIRDKRVRGIPVIVFSAVGEVVKPIKADGFLRKPVSPKMLLSTIESLLRPPPD
jgi:two-component system response regulator MprA